MRKFRGRMVMGHVYCITNKINGKQYVGKTEYDDALIRYKEHIADSKKERNKDRALYRAFNKYGINNFSFEIIQSGLYGDELSNAEILAISLKETYRRGYNETLGGDGKVLYKFSKEELERTYQVEKSVKGVARKFGCDAKTIRKWLKHYEIPRTAQTSKLPRHVENLDTKVIYESLLDAARFLKAETKSQANLKTIATNISRCASGKRKSCLGYSWGFVG